MSSGTEGGGAKANAESIVAENYGRVYQAVLRLVHDPAEARDLTQETFAKAMGGLEGFRGESSVLTWLMRIARNVVLDHFRQATRSRETPLDGGGAVESIPETRAVAPGEAAERTESGACVQACVDTLRPAERQVIELHDMLGLTAAEISQMLGVSIGAVKIRLHRARTKLRSSFDQHCDLYTDDRNELACRPKPSAAAEVRRRNRRRSKSVNVNGRQPSRRG